MKQSILTAFIAATLMSTTFDGNAQASEKPSLHERLYRWRNDRLKRQEEQKAAKDALAKKKEEALKKAERKLVACARNPSPVCSEVRRCQDARNSCAALRSTRGPRFPGPSYGELAYQACSVSFSACVGEAIQTHASR